MPSPVHPPRPLRRIAAGLTVVLAIGAGLAGCSDDTGSGTGADTADTSNADTGTRTTLEARAELTSADSRLAKVGPDEERTYGWNRLVGTATTDDGPVEIEMLGNVDYLEGNGPFFGFVTLTESSGDRLAVRMDGRATVAEDGSTALEATFEVVGGTGRYLNAGGTGSLSGSRTAAVGAPIEIVITLELTGVAATPAKSTDEAHWSYSGEEGPERWAELDPAFAACADGSAQTPIDIVDPEPAQLADPEFAYIAGPVEVHNNGHTVQADAAPGGLFRIDGEEFPLAQLHFHSPGEHTTDGESSPVEVHFVHKTADDEIAVVGVLVTEGPTDNPAWAPFVQSLDLEDGERVAATFDWPAMLPNGSGTIRYSGSLTTPPCTEGVRWFVMTERLALSRAQIEAFEAAYSGNNRPVQPLNERPLVLDSPD